MENMKGVLIKRIEERIVYIITLIKRVSQRARVCHRYQLTIYSNTLHKAIILLLDLCKWTYQTYWNVTYNHAKELINHTCKKDYA